MAKVFRRAGGKPITEIIARHSTVQLRLDELTLDRAVVAEGLLNTRARHRTNTSSIQVERGRIDRYVVLDDTRGLDAAMTIEYGRTGYEDDKGEWHGASDGLWVLHDAFNLDSPRREGAKPRGGRDNLRD